MIASTAAAAMNSLDAPVIGNYPYRLLGLKTQECQQPFRDCGPQLPETDESKKRQDIVRKTPRRLSIGVPAMIGDAFLEKADDRHHPIPQKGRDARPIGLALRRGREPTVEADTV